LLIVSSKDQLFCGDSIIIDILALLLSLL